MPLYSTREFRKYTATRRAPVVFPVSVAGGSAHPGERSFRWSAPLGPAPSLGSLTGVTRAWPSEARQEDVLAGDESNRNVLTIGT